MGGIGALVRVVGLNKIELNHHVGRIAAAGCDNGRIGVSLHNSIFTNNVRSRRAKQYAAMSVKPENLQIVQKPVPGTSQTFLGTAPGQLILRLFGEAGWGLPDDVAQRLVECLSLRTLDPNEVSVVGSSSCRGDFPISAVLNTNDSEWWISDNESMPHGRGCEYLEFSFGGLRRISYVALKIPPLPHGPLSVRLFHILKLRPGMSRQSTQSDAWVVVSPNPLQTLDREGLQEFALIPPCEAECLRLVCTANAASMGEDAVRSFLVADCVGLFQVAWA